MLTSPPPPVSPLEPFTEILHGVSVTDPYRWLENQNSLGTRRWIEEQTAYARAYLDNIPSRDRIHNRVREFLDVEIYDSLQKAGNRYFFRKRLPKQEQPCIYMRDGADGADQLLLDPAERGTGNHTAIKPLRVSPNGKLLLYEVKEGGERTATLELLDIESRRALPEVFPRGHLRGFAFSPDGKSFCYVHEALESRRPFYRVARRHHLGTSFREDKEIFIAGDDPNLRLCLIADATRIGFLVYRFLKKTSLDFHLSSWEECDVPMCVVAGAEYALSPLFVRDRILAITDCAAPNRRVVELRPHRDGASEWIDLIPECDSRIQQWAVLRERLFLSYVRNTLTRICMFSLSGELIEEVPIHEDETLRIVGGLPDEDELLLERESFTEPVETLLYNICGAKSLLWARKRIPFASAAYSARRVRYQSKDGTQIPMFLVGQKAVLAGGSHPTILTAYGGYGVSMTPQFSVLVAFLMEQGCLFALPNIRGGSEFGTEWHGAAKRRNRQTAYDDFLWAAKWLIETGLSTPNKLAIFGGSNSGLLVGAAMTQRPDLFRAVLCMVPMMDMLRYHLFDNAHVWKDEYGTADDPEDFSALANYSPYHQVRTGIAYPATMIVSGDADGNCNPLHARKMTARLQASNTSELPIFLDYSRFRGHSPVLPLSDRIEALTDRLAFLCDQLELPV